MGADHDAPIAPVILGQPYRCLRLATGVVYMVLHRPMCSNSTEAAAEQGFSTTANNAKCVHYGW